MKGKFGLVSMLLFIILLLTACGESNDTKALTTPAATKAIETPAVILNSKPIAGLIYGFAPSTEGTYIQIEGYEAADLEQPEEIRIPRKCFDLPVKRMSMFAQTKPNLYIPSTIEGKAHGFPYFIYNSDDFNVTLQANNPYLEIKDGMLFTKGLKELLYISSSWDRHVLPKETTRIHMIESIFCGIADFTVDQCNPVYYYDNGELYEKKSDKSMFSKDYSDYFDEDDYYYNTKSPENLRSPYEGYSFKILNNDKNKKRNDLLLSKTTDQYAVITRFGAKDSVLKLPDKIFDYPVLCASIDNENCKELIIPEDFCGFYNAQLVDIDDAQSNYVEWNAEFPQLPKLKKITLLGDNPLFTLKDNVLFSKDMKRLYGVCAARTGSYTVPDSVTELISYSFAGTNLEEITINSNVKKISDYVFSGSKKLKRLVVNNTKYKYNDIELLCAYSQLSVRKVERHGNQRIFHLE